MPNSLRCKVKKLGYKGLLSDKDVERICKALSQEPCEDAVSREEAIMCLTGINLPTDTDKLIALYHKRIKALPSVNPTREHGTWISIQPGILNDSAMCSKCKERTMMRCEFHYKFCPKCGAEMKGESDGR